MSQTGNYIPIYKGGGKDQLVYSYRGTTLQTVGGSPVQ